MLEDNLGQKELWDSKWRKLDKVLPPSKYAQEVLKKIKNNKTDNLLDIGCGSGKDSIFFAKKGINVTALDFSEEACKLVNGLKEKEGLKNIEIVCSDFLKFHTEKTFDIIYSDFGLHFFKDKETKFVFVKVFNLLSKKGLFFFRVKTVKDPLFGKGEKVEDKVFLFEGKLRHFFDECYLKKILNKFNVLEIREKVEEQKKINSKPEQSHFFEVIVEKK